MAASWVHDILGGAPPGAEEKVVRHGVTLVDHKGIALDQKIVDAAQAQTRDMFAFKWQQESTCASESMSAAQTAWLDSRYGGRDLLARLGHTAGDRPLVLDAGCGSGFTAKLLFKDKFHCVRFVGADISEAVDIAVREIGRIAPESYFVQADLLSLPSRRALSISFSPRAFFITRRQLARFTKPSGILAIYVYNRKAPIREFTDDHVRAKVADLTPQDAWKALKPLTKLGIALGELKTEIEVAEDVDVLGIKKGRYDIQRLFYWAICKAYYRPEFSFDEMNHINFDWFTPKYCHRQTPEEVAGAARQAC